MGTVNKNRVSLGGPIQMTRRYDFDKGAFLGTMKRKISKVRVFWWLSQHARRV
jgi:hypothetical protein